MKRTLWIVFAVMALVALSFTGAQAKNIVIKYANTVAPDHPNNIAALKFAELVAEKTNGKVKVEVFPAAQLGNEKELIEACMLGSLHMFQASSGALSLFQPEYGALACPYIFRDMDHMLKVAAGPVGQELAEKVQEKQGYHPVGQQLVLRQPSPDHQEARRSTNPSRP